jgi:hypothetical protein
MGAGLGQYLAGDVVEIGQARADGRIRLHGREGASDDPSLRLVWPRSLRLTLPLLCR